MSELGELERRIAEALERIRAGVEGMASAPAEDVVAASEADALAEQLSLVTADLAEATDALSSERAKVGDLGSKVESLAGALADKESEADALKADLARGGADGAKLEAAEAELRTLRQTVQELQTANAELRRSALSGVTDPGLINRSLAADLEAVQAARLAELRDLDSILKLIAPILGETAHA